MKISQAFLILFALGLSLMAQQASFEEKVTSAANLEMTINNLGMIGNSFGGSFDAEGFSSCQYPMRPTPSGVEHIFDGGLWVSALINGLEAVTTGAVDASSGYSTGRAGFEFSGAEGTGLEEQSSLFNSPFYNPFAVSHQDFVSDFSDKEIFVPGTGIQIVDHDNPLGIDVHFESYNWNFSFADFFVILNYRITNTGSNNLDDLHVGFWMDGVVRNVNISAPFTGGSAFFNKGGNGYEDSLYMAYEFDASGDVGFTESYVGLKFLGAEDNSGFRHPALDPTNTFQDHFSTWLFQNAADPLLFFPDNDNKKYDKMILGLNRNPIIADWEAFKVDLKNPNNRSNLVSTGPYGTLLPGESVNIAFAVIVAPKNGPANFPQNEDTEKDRAILIKHANWAQTAYNGEDVNFNGILDPGEDRNGDGLITRFILPTPPEIPNTRIVADDHSIKIFWAKNSENSVDAISKKKDFEGYRIYKSQTGFDVKDDKEVLNALKLVASFDKSGNNLFFDTGFEKILLPQPEKFEGDTNDYWYKFEFQNIQNGWQHAVAITAFDEGDPINNLPSLETSSISNSKLVFPGKVANGDMKDQNPFVYPNPYYAGASWEGSSSFEEDRKIIFANLPARCEIRIYTTGGDLVDLLEHDENYSGEDIRWFETYSNSETTQFSGGEHAWDLLSESNQIIARGIYLFSVKDLDSGKNFKGKFVVIK